MRSIHLAQNPVFHAHTKHIKMHYQFIEECIQVGDIDLKHISTNLQVANIFTKALGVHKLKQFMKDLGLTIVAFPSLRGRYNNQ